MPDYQVPPHYRPLEGSERRAVHGARRVRPADPDEILSVTVCVRRRPGAPPSPAPEEFATGDRPRLSQQEFAALYGASDADLKLVEQFAAAHHLTVSESSVARRTVILTGTVARMNEAFGVDLGHYEAPTETYRGREGSVHLPPELIGIVTGVFGLDNRQVGKLNGDPPNTVPLTAPRVAGLYNFPTNSAAGTTIGILTLGGGYRKSDITTFYNNLGAAFTAPTITDVLLGGATNSPSNPASGADREVTADICTASAVAQGANVAVYFTSATQAGWVNAITRAVHPNPGDPVPSVFSISWYIANGDDSGTLSGEGISTAFVNAVSAAFQDAATMGVTILIASGDTGSDSKKQDGNAHVQYPGSDPWVTSCGGTTVGNIVGSTFTEVAWNDTAFAGGKQGASGGGVSDFFDLPSWQNNAGIPLSLNSGSRKGRGVPDIAGNASPASGYGIVVNGAALTYGGTSITAPHYAGLIALINASLKEPVGYLNPILYSLRGTAVFRDIADGGNNSVSFPKSDGTTGNSPSYVCGPGWDACTGLGRVDGNQLLAALQRIFQKKCTLITDRSSFGKEEVDAMLKLGKPAVIQAAFFVTIDGFRATDLGINAGNLANPNATAPTLTLIPSVSAVSISATALQPEDPTLPGRVMRFTWTYQIAFNDSSGFNVDTRQVLLVASLAGVSNTGFLVLTKQPNPYEIDGPISWLSTDLRVFQVRSGDRKFGVTSLNTPDSAPAFIQQVLDNLNFGNTDGQSFEQDISTDETASQLELSYTQDGHPVFNYAIARVRYRAISTQAQNVRVFFRLFQVATTSTEYQPATTYLRGGQGGVVIPLVGIENGEIVTIPFFAAPRVDTTSATLDTQQDPKNVRTIVPNPSGAEVDAYFGCWLDINQNAPAFPVNTTNPHGPFNTPDVKTIQELIRGAHQCLVAEIAFDLQPITLGVSPAVSDKLAQRNLAIVASDNPGSLASHRIPHTFDVIPTLSTLQPGELPDELMIDWGNTPAGSTATIYLPAVSADTILDLANELYPTHALQRIDANTIQCRAGGMTFAPLPSGVGSKFAGLLTVDLPATVTNGQVFKVVVRQVTNSSRREPAPPPPPAPGPHINLGGDTAVVNAVAVQPRFRKVRGAFQITIPVRTKSVLLAPEERLLAVLRWIQKAIPLTNRWYPVFQRYLGQIAERVDALGGDQSQVLPSPTGTRPEKGHPRHPVDHGGIPCLDLGIHYTGKITGLLYDRFGDFEGFLLDTEQGERAFKCREHEMEDLAKRAWHERTVVTVLTEKHDPCHPKSLILRRAPRPFQW